MLTWDHMWGLDIWACEESMAVQKTAMRDVIHTCAWLADLCNAVASCCCAHCTVLLLVSWVQEQCVLQRHWLEGRPQLWSKYALNVVKHVVLKPGPSGTAFLREGGVTWGGSTFDHCLLLCCQGPQQEFCPFQILELCHKWIPVLPSVFAATTKLAVQASGLCKLAVLQSWEFIVSGSCWFTSENWEKYETVAKKASVLFKAWDKQICHTVSTACYQLC